MRDAGPDGQSYVKLSHFTVKEFLTFDAVITKGDAAQFHVNREDAHTLILAKYLQYLSFSDFDNIAAATAMRKYDLLSHAAHAWPHHLRFSRVWERSPSYFREHILPYQWSEHTCLQMDLAALDTSAPPPRTPPSTS